MLKKVVIIGTACLILLQVQHVEAQSRKEKKEIIIKGNDKGEKMVIVVDGDKVTLNGEEITGHEDKEMMIMKEPIIGGRFKLLMDSVFDMNTEPVAQLGVLTAPNETGVKGAEVKEVMPESAASLAGIKEKDIIQEVDGKSIQSPEDLVKLIRSQKPGDKVEIVLLRDGKKMTIAVKLGSTPRKPEMKSFRMEGLPGFEGMMDDVMKRRGPLPFAWEGREMRPRMGVQLEETASGKGLKVLEVEPGSPAEKSGLIKDDIINKIGDREVSTVDDVREALAGDKSELRVDVSRAGKKVEIIVKIPKPLNRGRF